MGYMQRYDDLVEEAIEDLTRTVREKGQPMENGEKFLKARIPYPIQDKTGVEYDLTRVVWHPEGPEGGYITFYCHSIAPKYFRKHEMSPFTIMNVADDLCYF